MAVPVAVVTETATVPVWWASVVAWTSVAPTTVKLAAGVVPKWTALVPRRLSPVMVTMVPPPAIPKLGATLVIEVADWVPWYSKAPASQRVWLDTPGRGSPRSSVLVVHAAAGTSSKAELVGPMARVWGPVDVLAASVVARLMVVDVLRLVVPKPQLSPVSTL